jgi:hypothetical protein
MMETLPAGQNNTAVQAMVAAQQTATPGSLTPQNDPSNPSSDYLAMCEDWQMIADIREGARRIKSKSIKYLPKYGKESERAYKLRLASTPWRPEFVDALSGICSKPFTKPVALQGTIPEQIKVIVEDIDGQGNDLHSFARETFQDGVASGLDAIYVTYPDVEPNKTLAQDKAAGARPYWVHIDAENIIACYVRKINGRDVVEHIRIRETIVSRNGFAETVRECIRVIELPPPDQDGREGWPVWSLYEKTTDPRTGEPKWIEIESGVLTVPEIPIVLYFTGERSGMYRVKAPLADLANMQLEIYRAHSREDEILTYAGSPMLTAKGMTPPAPTPEYAGNLNFPHHGVRRMGEPPVSELEIGPKTILFAPPGVDGAQASWDFIQPDAANIKAIGDNVVQKVKDFRRLALQPMTPESGRLTATSSAIDAAKAHSAVECWALGLKDALEQAFVFTAHWLKIDATVEVSVHTDFGVDIEGFDEFVNITNLRTAGDLSRETIWQEAMRRGILGPQFDPVKEATLVDAEAAKAAKDALDQQAASAKIVLEHTPSLPGAGVTA